MAAVADHGAVLVHAIVVGGDGAAADVGVVAEPGVAHIAQVRHFGAVADVRLLHLDECAGLGVLAELVARTQVGPRSDVRARPDMRFLHTGTFDYRTLVHGRVDKGGVRADDGVLADHRMALQEGAGQDGGVAADLDVVLDPGGLRIENGHAIAHPAFADAAVVGLGQGGQLHAVVHALDGERVRGGERADLAGRLGGFQCVGQVELALRVVRLQSGDRLGEHGGLEHVDRGVHLLHGEFAAVGVLLLDDAQHVAFAVADDAAVAGRVVEDGGEHGGAVAGGGVEFDQAVQRLAVEQRHVGGGDEHRAVDLAGFGELGHRALDGAAGAGDVVLVHDGDLLVIGAGGFGDALGLEVHDHGQRVGIQGGHRIHDPVQEGLACKSMQHLRLVGTHAGTLAGGEDDGCG